MVEEGPSALVCGRPHYLGRQVSYHAPRKQLTTLRAAPLLPFRALGVVILIARELQSLKGRGTGHPHSQGATVLEATVLEGEGNAPTSTQNMHKPPEYPIMDQTESGKRVTGILRERGLFSQVDPLQGGHAAACMSEDMRLVKHSFGDGPLVDSQTSPLQ